MTYFRAHRLDDALAQLAHGSWRVLCGATDCYAETGVATAQVPWLDISRIESLRGIARRDGEVRIGAATCWDDIDRSDLLPDVLREAARAIGTRQIRLQGTIGGNLCHAAPAADGVPALLSLDAAVELASLYGMRRLPLDQFLLGRRRTALRPDELLCAVVFDASHAAQPSSFVKLANREGSALAVVSAAVRLRWREPGVLAQAAVAVGSASEVPVRARVLEAAMEGRRGEDLARIVRESPMPELTPIDDCRGTVAQRRILARVAIERALVQGMRGQHDTVATGR